jgi:predicted LPLAT superfamily acyltransferase
LPGVVSNGRIVILANVSSYGGDISAHIKNKIVNGDNITLLTDIPPWYELDEYLKDKKMILGAPMMFPQPKTIDLDMSENRSL